jgi:hypothetical protein
MVNEFIQKANIKHNFKYDYSLINYVNSATKVEIICKEGHIFTQTPNHHLMGHGCRICNHKLRNDLDEQIGFAIANGFEYINHENIYNIKLKDKYGIYNISIKSLRLGFLPNIKCAINKTENFINRMVEIYGDKFDFSETVYITDKTKIKVKCNTCNLVSTPTPNNFMKNHYCYHCVRKKSKFTKNSFIISCDGKMGILYIIKCYNNVENFYKIGITSKSIKSRFGKGLNSLLPYNYEIIQEINAEPSVIWELERQLIKLYSPYKYTPLQKFCGRYECFILI